MTEQLFTATSETKGSRQEMTEQLFTAKREQPGEPESAKRGIGERRDGGYRVLSGVDFSPQEERRRHSRAGGNPEIPQSTGLCAWMPACAGTTDRSNQACGKPGQLRITRKTW